MHIAVIAFLIVFVVALLLGRLLDGFVLYSGGPAGSFRGRFAAAMVLALLAAGFIFIAAEIAGLIAGSLG